MTSRVSLSLLLVAGHALLLVFLAPPDSMASERARLVRDSLLVAQSSLLIGWAILGPGPAWLRIPASAILTGGVLYALNAVGQEWTAVRSAIGVIATSQSVNSSAVAYGGWWVRFAIMLAAGFASLRLLGWSVHVCDDDPKGPPAQFSIRTILILTTLIAVVCWAGPRLQLSASSGPVPDAFAYWSVAIPLALAAIATHCAVLRAGVAFFRLVLAAVWVIAMGLVPTYLCNRQDDVWQMLGWTAMSSAALAVSLFAVRGTGAYLLRGDEDIATEWAAIAIRSSIHPSWRATTAQAATIMPLDPAD